MRSVSSVSGGEYETVRRSSSPVGQRGGILTVLDAHVSQDRVERAANWPVGCRNSATGRDLSSCPRNRLSSHHVLNTFNG